MNILKKLVQGIGFAAGVAVWIASWFNTMAKRQVEIVRRKELLKEWKTHVEPQVLLVKDTFGFSHKGMLKPDADKVTAHELFAELAAYAVVYRASHADETGKTVDSMTVSRRLRVANRSIKVVTRMHFIECILPDKVVVVHPAAERLRWKDLDRAMKCFLN